MTAIALTQEERAKTRYYLGYPNLESRNTTSLGLPIVYRTALLLEENMRSILDTFSYTIVQGLLADLAISRCKISAAKDRLSVTEIAYAVKINNKEINQLWQEDYRLCQQLARLLAAPIYSHPWGPAECPQSGTNSNASGDIPIIYS